MEKLLTIIIPTYNRCSDVCKNVLYLDDCISKYSLQEKVKVVVSDNHSEDKTYDELLKLKCYLKNEFDFYIQCENIGGSHNSRQMLKIVETPFVMLLGDDDFIDELYLLQALKYIENDKKISAILPNFYSNQSVNCRDDIDDDCYLEAGSQHLRLMFKAHQMSGLIFKADGVLDSLYKKNGENRYYQVYCIGFNMLRGKTVHITRYPVCVNVTNKKYWTYGNDNLWDDMYLNIQLLDISEKEKLKLERYYLLDYSWSSFPRFLRHPIHFLKAVKSLQNMHHKTKILVIPYMFISVIIIVYQKKIKGAGKR